MKRNSQTQRSGDNSTNVQIGHVNYGVSYTEARQIALDVFKANFYELSEQASQVAVQRASKFVDQFLGDLQKQNPDGLSKMNDPDIQHSFVQAQIEYARLGDDTLSDMLCNLLVDRTKEEPRSFKSIVLNQSLTTVGLLTPDQLNLLSIVFLLRHSRQLDLRNIDSFRAFIEAMITPFKVGLNVKQPSYQHLEFTGCATVSITSLSLENIFRTSYPGLLSSGFDLTAISNNLSPEAHRFIVKHHISCLHNESLDQINALNDDILRNLMDNDGITNSNVRTEIEQFYKNNVMNDKELKSFLVGLHPIMEELVETWNSTSASHTLLTSVGISIAIANVRRQTGVQQDLSIWIH